MKFAFIHAEKAQFPIAVLCRVLGVTRQGYYAFVRRAPSARVGADEALRKRIDEVFVDSRETYGSPRIQRVLQAEGTRVGKTRIERLMRALGLQARSPRRFRRTTICDASHPVAPNTLDRAFTGSAPNERWVADITYVLTGDGWCYLAVLLDLFSRGIVGWSLDTTLCTSLPLAALRMAVGRRGVPSGLLHHSDRGSQYTSTEYRTELERLGITASMSRKGNCWDNAVAESFFATLKVELIDRRVWTSQLELRAALFDYIETFYNRRRLHSSIGYKTPAQIEREHELDCAA